MIPSIVHFFFHTSDSLPFSPQEVVDIFAIPGAVAEIHDVSCLRIFLMMAHLQEDHLYIQYICILWKPKNNRMSVVFH